MTVKLGARIDWGENARRKERIVEERRKKKVKLYYHTTLSRCHPYVRQSELFSLAVSNMAGTRSVSKRPK